jgi:hypothetical protein
MGRHAVWIVQWTSYISTDCRNLVHMWYVATYVNYAFLVSR